MIQLEEIRKIPDVSEACWQIGISPDNRYLALSLYNEPNVVQLCDLEGKVFKKLKGHRGMIHSIEFSEDGRTIASASADKSVRIWSPTGDLLALFDRFDNSVESVKYAPKVPILAGGQIDGRITMFDIAGNYIATLQSPKSRIYCLDWSADSNFLAAACADRNLYLYNVKMQTRHVYSHPGPVYGVSFSNRNGRMVSSCEDGSLRFINIYEDTTDVVKGHEKRVVGVAFSPDDRFVVTSSFDKTVKFFDRYGNLKSEYKLDSEALGVTFSRDGKKLYVSTKDRYLIVYQINLRA